MAQVIWSPTAMNDLEAIADYIGTDSPAQAALFVTRLKDATGRLANFPESGRGIKGISDTSVREIIVGAYRIMYRIKEGDVWIDAVVHGARKWPPKR